VRGDEVATPPVTAGILESVTARLMCEMLQADFGVRVIQREIDRTELYVADEVFMAGTLREVQPVIQIDDVMIGDGAPGDRTRSWQRRFFEICAGADQKKGWLTPLARERAAVDV